MKPVGIDLDSASDWDQVRWATILDRIEHRQRGIGLRFWGPPLWLEVTMSGPDSDLWPTVSEQATSYDWQSSAPCDLTGPANEDADDDHLLAIVARYTIENLILNAVHETGEWLRFDGQRLFPAHSSTAAATSKADDQGNGIVTLQVTFGGTSDAAEDPAPDERRPDIVDRLIELAEPARFTYLPGALVAYAPAGPVIRTRSDGVPASAWRSAWSIETLEAASAGGPDAVALIGRDVHRAVVSHEADHICRAFHVDGRRPWRLRTPVLGLGPDPLDSGAEDAQLLSIFVDYADVSLRAASAPGEAVSGSSCPGSFVERGGDVIVGSRATNP